ncbi:MAG: glycerophosphodiester phosphodiesterase [Candidatus Odinarchaeota archaeon]
MPANRSSAFFQSDRPLVMAHRGNSSLYPENSLESFKDAVALKVDVLEVDARMTADGQLVVFHDETVDRVSNGKGRIIDHTLNELEDLDIGYHFTPDGGKTYPFRGKGMKILSLEDLFTFFPGQRFNIDIKNDNYTAVDAMSHITKKHGVQEHIFISSFHQRVIERFRKSNPDILTGAGPDDIRGFIKAMKLRYLWLLHPSSKFDGFQVPVRYGEFEIVTPGFVRAAHRKNLKVMVWTINDREEMVRLLKMGVDGLFTDDPALMIKVIEEEKFFKC